MNAEERKNIEEIKRGKDCFEAANVILGDRSPEYHYSARHQQHSWGFGIINSPQAERAYFYHRLGSSSFLSDRPQMKGGEIWRAFGRLHRLDGPAFSNVFGRHDWGLYGVLPFSWEVYRMFSTQSDADILMLKLSQGIIEHIWRPDDPLTLGEITHILDNRPCGPS